MGVNIGIIFGIIVTMASLIYCRDFYMGMFKKNDYLVAQDRVFKERAPHRRAIAKYLKVVRCPLTYIRVADRLGVGGGPTVRIVRGGLHRNHVYLYLYSSYNLPLSVAIYLGCVKPIPKAAWYTTIKAPDLHTRQKRKRSTTVNSSNICVTTLGPDGNTTNECNANSTGVPACGDLTATTVGSTTKAAKTTAAKTTTSDAT